MARGRRKKWTPKAHAPPPISERKARLQSRRTRLQVLDLPSAAASPPAFSAPFPLEPTHIHKSSSKPNWKSSLEDVFEDVEPAGSSQRGFSDDVDATHSHSPVRLRRSINEVDLSPGSEKKLYEPQIRQRVDYSSLQSRRSMTSLQGDNPKSLDPPVPESRPHGETSDYGTVAGSAGADPEERDDTLDHARMDSKVFCADLVQTAPVRDSPSSHQFSVASSICSSEESNTHESDDLLGHDDSALNMEGERVFNAQLRYRLTQLLNLSSEIPLGKIYLDFDDVTSSVTERLSPRPFKSILLGSRHWPSPSKFRSATCGVTAYEYNGDLFLSLRDVFNGARNITVPWTPDARSSNLVFRDDTGLEHRWSFRAITQLRHQHISTKSGVAMSPDGELQWHQFDGLNPMGEPECAAIIQCHSNKAMDDLAGIDDYRPRAICCANRYEVMGLELGVVEEGAQAGRQTFKKFREAGSARKCQFDKLRILEKAFSLHPGHSLFEDEYRAHKPVMVKFRCPTCAAGGLGTKDAKMHHMCERGVNEGSARRRGLGSSLERNVSLARSCAWAYISEAWRLVKVHDYGVHRDGLGVRALAEVSCPEESVNLQLVPGNKLAWSFSNAKQLAGSKNREFYLSLQVPTEAILEKTLGTNASLAKTFIKDTKKTIKHLNVGK
ncbi:BQ5605_C031g10936 [Microbotryum silenes-dioicae]|uniref:BQ5605_C031g10936 protein n=1 Tax=Microbotryum silenes-dioicae TaxID=796604 RepID=A0A2X0PBZ0_9BASI|nr:BQ5605_C031g10936 [Microbotryum silenes-dioicae]